MVNNTVCQGGSLREIIRKDYLFKKLKYRKIHRFVPEVVESIHTHSGKHRD